MPCTALPWPLQNPISGSQLGREFRVWILGSQSPPFPMARRFLLLHLEHTQRNKSSLTLCRCSIKTWGLKARKESRCESEVPEAPPCWMLGFVAGMHCWEQEFQGKNEFLLRGTWDAVTTQLALLELFYLGGVGMIFVWFWSDLEVQSQQWGSVGSRNPLSPWI